MTSINLDDNQVERRIKRILPELLEDIDAMRAQFGVEVCIITKGPHDTRPTIWASHAMVEKLVEASKEAEVDNFLKANKRLEETLVKIKQIREIIEKLKQKRRSEDAFVKHQMNDDGKPSSISELPPSSFAGLTGENDHSVLSPPQGSDGSSSKGGNI
jgi:hypothetical protein